LLPPKLLWQVADRVLLAPWKLGPPLECAAPKMQPHPARSAALQKLALRLPRFLWLHRDLLRGMWHDR
jgi:hypothetical protein